MRVVGACLCGWGYDSVGEPVSEQRLLGYLIYARVVYVSVQCVK